MSNPTSNSIPEKLQAMHEALSAGAASVAFGHELQRSPMATAKATQTYLLSRLALEEVCHISTHQLSSMGGIPLVQVNPDRPIPDHPLHIVGVTGFDPGQSTWSTIASPAEAVTAIRQMPGMPIPAVMVVLEPSGLETQFLRAIQQHQAVGEYRN